MEAGLPAAHPQPAGQRVWAAPTHLRRTNSAPPGGPRQGSSCCVSHCARGCRAHTGLCGLQVPWPGPAGEGGRGPREGGAREQPGKQSPVHTRREGLLREAGEEGPACCGRASGPCHPPRSPANTRLRLRPAFREPGPTIQAAAMLPPLTAREGGSSSDSAAASVLTVPQTPRQCPHVPPASPYSASDRLPPVHDGCVARPRRECLPAAGAPL